MSNERENKVRYYDFDLEGLPDDEEPRFLEDEIQKMLNAQVWDEGFNAAMQMANTSIFLFGNIRPLSGKDFKNPYREDDD